METYQYVLLGLAALGLLFWVLLFLYVLIGYYRAVHTYPVPSDAIVVLGTHLQGDKPGALMRRRLELALQLYRAGAAKYIIVCGGKRRGKPPTEAVAMAVWLVQRGMPSRYVVREGVSRDTRENITNAKRLLDLLGFHTCIIVSSDFHLYRAMSIARHRGMIVSGSAAKTPGALFRIRLILRETLGWCKMWFTREAPGAPLVLPKIEEEEEAGA